MDSQLERSLAELGVGAVIALSMAAALVKAFFRLLAENRAMRRDLLQQQHEWQERFFLGLVDCINRNTASMEKMERSLNVVHNILEGVEDYDEE